MQPRPFPRKRAEAVAKELDLSLDGGICHACLSFVSFALDDGTPAEISGKVRQMTPVLWLDGLEEQALAAARQACERGVHDAEAALADLELNGGRSATARAIVRRLAGELTVRTRIELRVEALTRSTPLSSQPERN
jgi:hypothetical protein